METNFWVERDRWPYIRPSLAFLPEVFDEVGSAIFGDAWTGREMTELSIHPELPSPTKVFVGDTDVAADQALYNQFRERAFDLLGVAKGHSRLLPISWEQWREARDRWIAIELAELKAGPRRTAVFRLLHDAAAEGTLRFKTRMPKGGQGADLSPTWWDYDYDIILPRFVTCAMPSKIDFAKLPPPKDPFDRANYLKRFDLPLVVSRQNLKWALPHLINWHEGRSDHLPAFADDPRAQVVNNDEGEQPEVDARPVADAQGCSSVIEKRAPNRPEKRTESLRIFRNHVEQGRVKQDRAEEARLIIRDWSKEGPPKQDTVSAYLKPFYEMARWSDGKLINAIEIFSSS